MPKPCDACHLANALIFCKADSAFLCMACDSGIHTANQLASRHERVLVCEVCENAPAAVVCNADAASLCLDCDADIHSANPLAHRHERVPITPLIPTHNSNYNMASNHNHPYDHEDRVVGSAVVEGSPWPLYDDNDYLDDGFGGVGKTHGNRATYGDDSYMGKPGLFTASFGVDFDEDQKDQFVATDSVVPVYNPSSRVHLFVNGSQPPCLGELLVENKSLSFTPAASQNQSVSSTSGDVGVVPDVNYSYEKATPAAPFASLCGVKKLEPKNREARVLRYKERRKNRRFDKTIRYASRKVYAESRPRIKGRFAKRSQTNVDELTSDCGFGVVPSL